MQWCSTTCRNGCTANAVLLHLDNTRAILEQSTTGYLAYKRHVVARGEQGLCRYSGPLLKVSCARFGIYEADEEQHFPTLTGLESSDAVVDRLELQCANGKRSYRRAQVHLQILLAHIGDNAARARQCMLRLERVAGRICCVLCMLRCMVQSISDRNGYV